MENEEHSSGSEAGAADTGAQQGAEGASQEAAGSQSSESASVDSGESQASSTTSQARQKQSWANQRVLEKTIGKLLSSTLDERLAPILERLNAPAQNPQGKETPENLIDYNDLQGSITKLVEKALESRMNSTLPKLKDELKGEFSSTSKMQEARNYLVSQSDIGQDQSRHDQIREIIANDVLLYNSIGTHPLAVMQEAVKRWKSGRTNPNVPGKDELSTVTGGTATRRNGEPSMQKIRELQDKVISSNLPVEEREKLNREIDSLMALTK